ncbi:BTB/POZ protein [Rhizophagus irregularis DAOM 181602=DAOM 197198]|nr:BTB/POZ protein [Rhizophagus irregularis DAOM 181602=DAOM 197198]
MLSTNKKNNDGTLVHIKLPNILPEIFQIILRYIYKPDKIFKSLNFASIPVKLLITIIQSDNLQMEEIQNSDDIESYILSRVKNERFAIYNYYDNGPNFSNSLTLMDNFGFCENDYYENQIRETYDNFFMEEYEVFQAIREISS